MGMGKVFEKMLKKAGKIKALAPIVIAELEKRKQQGSLSKNKADALIIDIKKQLEEVEEE